MIALDAKRGNVRCDFCYQANRGPSAIAGANVCLKLLHRVSQLLGPERTGTATVVMSGCGAEPDSLLGQGGTSVAELDEMIAFRRPGCRLAKDAAIPF